jgi:hypothetical protein
MSDRANKRLKLQGEISNCSQTKVTTFIESSIVNTEYQECLINWIVSSYQPLSAIQNDSFRTMIQLFE